MKAFLIEKDFQIGSFKFYEHDCMFINSDGSITLRRGNEQGYPKDVEISKDYVSEMILDALDEELTCEKTLAFISQYVEEKELIDIYLKDCVQPPDLNQRSSDIWQLLPFLHEYSNDYNHITEVGTRHGVSTHAFMLGLPNKLVCYDIGRTPEIDVIEKLAKEVGVELEFHQQDILKTEIEKTDVLFIDSYHIAGQCAKELELHAGKVKHRIMFHDVAEYGYWEKGEVPYNGLDVGGLDARGLRYAIEPFLENNKEWKEIFRTQDCNGLLIIERIS